MKQPRKLEILKSLGPLSLVRMAWKQTWLIATLAVIFICLAVAAIRALPNVYQAKALILVDSQKIPEKFVASTVQVSLQDSLSAIGQQVLNEANLQKIVSDFNLYPKLTKKRSREEVISRMKGDLTVTLERGLTGVRSGAFSISYEGPDPKVVAGVVNRVSELFIQENLKDRQRRAAGTSQFIDTQLQEAKKRLEAQEASLSAYKQEHAGDLPEQQGTLLGALSRLQTELQADQDTLHRDEQNKLLLENSLRFAEAAVASTSAMLSQPAPMDSSPAGAPQAATQPKSSEALRAELQALRLRYYDDHPAVRRLKAELAAAEAEERREAAPKGSADSTAKPKVAASPAVKPPPFATEQDLAEYNRERERVAATKTQLELNQKEIETINAKRQRILDQINDYQARLEKLPVREQQMADLTRDYETSKGNYQTLLDKKLSAEMAMDMEQSHESERFTVADPAHVPTKPIRPRRLLYAAAATGVSLVIALVLGLLFEIRKGQFLGEWEIPQNVRVLGRIPLIAQEGGI